MKNNISNISSNFQGLVNFSFFSSLYFPFYFIFLRFILFTLKYIWTTWTMNTMWQCARVYQGFVVCPQLSKSSFVFNLCCKLIESSILNFWEIIIFCMNFEKCVKMTYKTLFVQNEFLFQKLEQISNPELLSKLSKFKSI